MHTVIGIEFEELTFPDKTLAHLVDGGAIGVGLLQERLIKVVIHLTLSDKFFSIGEFLLGEVHIHIFAVPATATKTHFAVGVGHQIGLSDVALYVFRYLAGNFHNVFALFLDGLWQSKHISDFLEHTIEFAVEVLGIVDNAHVRMSAPHFYHLLVEFASYAQAFLVGLFQSCCIGGCGVELLGTVGSRHKVKHGIVAVAQLIGIYTHTGGDALPVFGLKIGGNVERAAVANYHARLAARLSHCHKLVLEHELDLQRGFLTGVEQVFVLGKIVHTRLNEHCGHFGHCEHFIAEARKVFYHSHKCCGLARARTAGQHYSFDVCVWHIFRLSLISLSLFELHRIV